MEKEFNLIDCDSEDFKRKEFNLSEKKVNIKGLNLVFGEYKEEDIKEAVRRLKEKWKEKGAGYDYMTCVKFLIEDINKIFGDKLT